MCTATRPAVSKSKPVPDALDAKRPVSGAINVRTVVVTSNGTPAVRLNVLVFTHFEEGSVMTTCQLPDDINAYGMSL